MGLDLHRVYEQEADAVFGFLGRFGLKGADLQDGVHDTFVTAMGRQASYDATKPVKPWLLGIAFRVAVAKIKQSRREPRGDFPQHLADGQSLEHRVDARRTLEQAQRVLAGLSEEQGVAFVQYELQGMKIADMAEAMQVPVATVYSRIRLARAAFNLAFPQQQPERARHAT